MHSFLYTWNIQVQSLVLYMGYVSTSLFQTWDKKILSLHLGYIGRTFFPLYLGIPKCIPFCIDDFKIHSCCTLRDIQVHPFLYGDIQVQPFLYARDIPVQPILTLVISRNNPFSWSDYLGIHPSLYTWPSSNTPSLNW